MNGKTYFLKIKIIFMNTNFQWISLNIAVYIIQDSASSERMVLYLGINFRWFVINF